MDRGAARVLTGIEAYPVREARDFENLSATRDEAWIYTNWLAGEPNDFMGALEDGLHFSGAAGQVGFWNDLPRTDTRDGYFVEFSAAPEPATLVLLSIALIGLGFARARVSNFSGARAAIALESET